MHESGCPRKWWAFEASIPPKATLVHGNWRASFSKPATPRGARWSFVLDKGLKTGLTSAISASVASSSGAWTETEIHRWPIRGRHCRGLIEREVQ